MLIEGIGGNDTAALDITMQSAQASSVSPELARQFEAIFLQSMFKSTCIDTHFSMQQETVSSGVPGTVDSVCERSIAEGLRVEQAVDFENSPAVQRLQADTHPSPTALPDSPGIDAFVKSLWPYAKLASHALGIDPKILLAQAALETGWGKGIVKDADGSSSHNLFNIKSRVDNKAESVVVKTTEYVANAPITMLESFKKYPSVAHSFNDYVSLIQGARYKEAMANAHDPKRYVNALHEAGYATDPHYAEKILSIYHGDVLANALALVDKV